MGEPADGWTLWEPLDPQPCCKNCEHADYNMRYGAICYEIDGRVPDDDFFCKYYEAKKVKE